MKNLFKGLIAVAVLSSMTQLANAQSCASVNAQVERNSAMYQPRLTFEIVGQKGYRSYLHIAPSDQCKQKNLFLIPKDSVIAYEEVRMNGQTWVSVMYVRKDGSTVDGWMKKKDLRQTGRMGF